ncbi:MAG: hypothetical protein JST14_03335 [Bacteroidetes bacterium]|nr:hypothetical protein [Bacteroidota bacterium]
MKAAITIAFLLILPCVMVAQVMLRNEFIIGKDHKIHNKGLSIVAINLDRHANMNMLVNGRGGKSLVIDVQAIRHPRSNYSYRELATRIYTPGASYRPIQDPVPAFLLQEPPRVKFPRRYAYSRYGMIKALHSQSFQER